MNERPQRGELDGRIRADRGISRLKIQLQEKLASLAIVRGKTILVTEVEVMARPLMIMREENERGINVNVTWSDLTFALRRHLGSKKTKDRG